MFHRIGIGRGRNDSIGHAVRFAAATHFLALTCRPSRLEAMKVLMGGRRPTARLKFCEPLPTSPKHRLDYHFAEHTSPRFLPTAFPEQTSKMQRCCHCGQYGRSKTHCPSQKRRRNSQQPRRTPQPRPDKGYNDGKWASGDVLDGMSNSSPEGDYQYAPFNDENSIRLLVLLPGNPCDPISCKLRIERTENAIPYEAISYVWGDPDDRVEILCHGQSLHITRSLMGALKKFRRKRKKRLLWADAVCINQHNDDEKGHQVQKMGKVFERARRVLAWLGLGKDLSPSPLFHAIRTLARMVIPGGSSPELESFIKEQYPGLIEDFKRLLGNPWFRRMWIAQEIGLASDAIIHCGEANLRWEDLKCVCTYFLTHWTILDIYGLQDVSFVGTLDMMRFRESHSDDVFLIAWCSKGRECLDDRDKVYALLGHKSFEATLMNADSELYLPVDYTISTSEVYTSFATRAMRFPNNYPLYLLSMVVHDENTFYDLANIPSWVPQLNVSFHSSIEFGEFPRFNTYGESSATCSIQGSTLSVRGFKFDSVAWVSDGFDDTFTLSKPGSRAFKNKNLTPLRQVWAYLHKRYQNDSINFLEAMCATIAAGELEPSINTDTRNRTDPGATGTWYPTLADAIAYLDAIGFDIPAGVKERVEQGDPYYFYRRLFYCTTRCFFVTSRGWMGIGPRVTSVGDDVCVFFGATTPLVAWELPSASESIYRLCGNSYIHGIMHGEAMKMWENGNFEDKTFNLI